MKNLKIIKIKAEPLLFVFTSVSFMTLSSEKALSSVSGVDIIGSAKLKLSTCSIETKLSFLEISKHDVSAGAWISIELFNVPMYKKKSKVCSCQIKLIKTYDKDSVTKNYFPRKMPFNSNVFLTDTFRKCRIKIIANLEKNY